MPRFKTRTAKDRLLRSVRRQRLKYITILPSLITILNGVCGFTAIVFGAKAAGAHLGEISYLALAGYMILLAMVADMLDGRLARMSQSTSSFGGQLDSLCDMISFGAAPAFLMVKILEQKLAGLTSLNPALVNFLTRFIWLTAAAYISCAAIRLARFNVENAEDESAHMSFMGLPSPAAAGVIVSLVLFHQEALPEISDRNTYLYGICEGIIIWVLPLFTLGAAALMVSRIRYPHVLNQYLRGKKPLWHLIKALVYLGLVICYRQAALVLIFCGFALNGFARWFYYRILGSRLALRREMKPSNVPES
ncbi:MAG: CDP-alcohol phosphatidyltransferase family protein [Planctomycetota bacterium]|jgi:CDP-diacylglycerol--serine O-phosphatidyltransferase